jgi:hypothetical protein
MGGRILWIECERLLEKLLAGRAVAGYFVVERLLDQRGGFRRAGSGCRDFSSDRADRTATPMENAIHQAAGAQCRVQNMATSPARNGQTTSVPWRW